MSQLRVAVVGVGALGRHHARILSELDGVELVAVVDSHADRGRQVANSTSTAWVARHQELYDRVDAVSIAVPTTAHRAVAGDFLSRGIPVLVEKPLARTLHEAEELVELAERQGTLLQVGHVERFNPAMEAAAKHCGAPKYIRCERLSPYTFRSTDIGVVLDLMIHDIDLVLGLVGAAVRRVDAFGLGLMGDTEDAVQARVSFENGCIADFTASRISPTPARTMQIWSQRGHVQIDFTTREVTRHAPTETLLFGTSPLERSRQPGADIEQLKKDVFNTFLKIDRIPVLAGDALTRELSSFVECVTEGRRPLVDGLQALRAMTVAERVLASVGAHQWDGHADGAIGPFARVPRRQRLAG